jgi:hypothetical protein
MIKVDIKNLNDKYLETDKVVLNMHLTSIYI